MKDKKEYGPLNILSQAEVARVLGVGISSIQRMRKDPDFPKRRRFGSGPKGWIYGEIERWVINAPVDDSEDEEEVA